MKLFKMAKETLADVPLKTPGPPTVDQEIIVDFEMCNAPKLHIAQT